MLCGVVLLASRREMMEATVKGVEEAAKRMEEAVVG